MDKHKAKKFKNQQKRLAKAIAKANGSTNFTINYEQQLPSAYTDSKTGKLIIGCSSQYIFPTTVIHEGKHRLIVIMHFHGVYDCKSVSKILKRPFEMKHIGTDSEIRISFNPHKISKL